MAENKNAVIVGRVELKPRREVIVGPRADAKREPQFVAKQDKPRRQERPGDPRTANTMQLAELQYQKQQVKKLQEENQRLANTFISARELLAEIDKADQPVTLSAPSPEKLAAVHELIQALRRSLGQ